MSSHTVHSYLRSIKCLASWLNGAGHLDANPFLAVNPYYKKKGVMPVLRADDRIPKIASRPTWRSCWTDAWATGRRTSATARWSG